ncbi:MAG TPA: peptidoglycan-binding domain-containing protein [Kofleriaceae bacterium]
MSIRNALLIGILAAVVPSCALDGDGPDGPEAARAGDQPGTPDDQASAADPETSIDSAAVTLASFPTCNSVRDWFNAAVPDWSGNGTVDCAMGEGADSPAVGRLQRTMNVCYGERLTVDNDFGPATLAALKRTQTKAGTTADGVYGPNTRKAMLHQSNDNANTCIHVP